MDGRRPDSGRDTELGLQAALRSACAARLLSFLEFFQIDRDTGGPKGIVAIDLGGLA